MCKINNFFLVAKSTNFLDYIWLRSNFQNHMHNTSPRLSAARMLLARLIAIHHPPSLSLVMVALDLLKNSHYERRSECIKIAGPSILSASCGTKVTMVDAVHHESDPWHKWSTHANQWRIYGGRAVGEDIAACPATIPVATHC